MSEIGTAVADVFRALSTRIGKTLTPVTSQNLWSTVFESFPGAWQSNVVVDRMTAMSYFAVYACISLVAQDIAKMKIMLMQRQESGVWKEIIQPTAFTPVLRKPNHFQNRIKFIENWVTSKLTFGNTYVLKVRDNRNVVVKMYVLDPQRVTPLVADTGDVYYALKTDYLATIQQATVTVPASEIIHDTAICLFHPLVGISPLYASGLAATQGIKIQNNSTKLFTNMSRPSGILTAPGAISNETAQRLKDQWEANYGGDNVGKTAVLGDGLTYVPMTISPTDAQLIEQLKMTGEMVCSTFHVPPYKVGIGAMPAYNNVEALNIEYYSQALQANIEQIELLLDEGLGLVEPNPNNSYGVQFDLDGLLRMDTASRYDTYGRGVNGGWMHPNYARIKENMEPVDGGDTPYLQQQNFSLEALNKRDTADDPFKTATPAKTETPPVETPPALPPPAKALDDISDDARMMADLIIRELTSASS